MLDDPQGSVLPLTVSQLEAFVATLEGGSFTAAADRLDVSQPAVAEQVRRLERAVGQSLFARQARGVRPTAMGVALEPHARRVLEAVADVTAAAFEANAVDQATIAFGTFGSPQHYELAGLIRAFLADHPGSRLRIVGRNSSSTADAVRSGALDAAIVALPIDDRGLDVRPLFAGEVFSVSADPRRVRRPVTIHALAERPLILYESSAGVGDPTRFQLAARAQAAGVELRPRLEVESADIALELAAQGLGDTYAPQILRPSLDRRLGSIGFDPPLVDHFALIVRSGSRLSRPVEAFVERVTTYLLGRITDAGAAKVAPMADERAPNRQSTRHRARS
jgi:DNA-binding transcriptional LysR family regulator